MAAEILTILLAILATARLTRLAMDDLILDRPRHWLTTKSAWLAALLECKWCTSIWAGVAVAWTGYEFGLETGWWFVAAGALSLSYVTAWLYEIQPE